jgi:hypothetical protein
MLPFNNRIYTSAELRAMSRLYVTDRQPIVVTAATDSGPAGSGHRALIAMAKRLLGRKAVGHPAPGTI